MMTTEGWTDIMANGIDAVGIEKEPKYNNKEYASLYFVAFMILGCFLLINLFTAVITDHINKVKENKELGTAIVSNEAQKQFVMIQNYAVTVKPIKKILPPDNKFRLWFYNIVQSNWFDLLIIIIIALNTIVVAMTYDRMSNSYEKFIEYANNFFVALYNIELILKFIGLGCMYFQDSWNIFDFI